MIFSLGFSPVFSLYSPELIGIFLLKSWEGQDAGAPSEFIALRLKACHTLYLILARSTPIRYCDRSEAIWPKYVLA